MRFDPNKRASFNVLSKEVINPNINFIRYIAEQYMYVGCDCPRCKDGDPEHELKEKKHYQIRPRYDYVDGHPAEVSLSTYQWWCRQCRITFPSRNPYMGNNKTTRYFDDYVAHTVITNPEMDVQYFVKNFPNISRSTFYDILQRFYARARVIHFDKLECDHIYALPLVWNHFPRLIVFGHPTENQRKVLKTHIGEDQYVIMGFAETDTLKALFEECVSLDHSPDSFSIFAGGAIANARDAGNWKQIKSIFPADIDDLPEEIEQVMGALKAMRARGITLQTAMVRAMLFDPFHVFRIAEAESQPWWSTIGPRRARKKKQITDCVDMTTTKCLCYCLHNQKGKDPAISLYNEDFCPEGYEVNWGGEYRECNENDALLCYYYSTTSGFLRRYGQSKVPVVPKQHVYVMSEESQE